MFMTNFCLSSTFASIFGFLDLSDMLRGTVFELFFQSGAVGKSVIILLILISIVSWAIIVERLIYFTRAFRETLKFEQMFKEMSNLSEVGSNILGMKKSPLVKLFVTGFNDFKIRQRQYSTSSEFSEDRNSHDSTYKFRLSDEIDGIARSLEKVSAVEVTRLEKRLFFLATAGAVSPFIGLFGTVWGIMNSFRGISVQSTAAFTVISAGISEALIATAAGLAVAIPAVIGFNYFNNRIKVFITHMEAFSWDFLNIVERWLKKKIAG